MRRALVLVVVSAAACTADRPPEWAFDPIWLEPTSAGIHGFQSWALYDRRWARSLDEKHYRCGVLVELWGSPVGCEDCDAAFTVQAELLEHDCELGWVQSPRFTALERVSIGGPVDGEVPHPGSTSASRVDYGEGWEPHGFAYASSLDHGESGPAAWDGAVPFQLWPSGAVPLP